MQPASWTARVALVGALLAAAVLAPFASAPVSAANPALQLATVRAQVDQLGNEFFAARQRLHALDGELARLRTSRARIERVYAKEHKLEVRRAVARYMSSDEFLPTDTSTALDVATRNVILEHAAATTNAAMARYVHVRSSMLDTERSITSQRQAQQRTVAELAARTRALDSDLAAAQRAYREMLVAQDRAAQARAAAATAAQRTSTATTAGNTPGNTALAPVPPTAKQPVASQPPPSPSGTNPHHNDPFLSCVRNRESSGIYSAVNPGGYYGAYQFAITTWNITASHAGEPGLIGVRPDHASAWDQDQLAWVLYQWQGMGPWGGGC